MGAGLGRGVSRYVPCLPLHRTWRTARHLHHTYTYGRNVRVAFAKPIAYQGPLETLKGRKHSAAYEMCCRCAQSVGSVCSDFLLFA